MEINWTAFYSHLHRSIPARVVENQDPFKMNPEQILSEIREANLNYLILAQNLIRADREQALYRLGVSEATADIIAALSPAQIMKIANCGTLLCRVRSGDEMVWSLLSSQGRAASAGEGMSRLHAGIVMAGRHQEAV